MAKKAISQKDRKALDEFRKKVQIIQQQTNLNPYETKLDKQERIQRAMKDPRYMVEYYFPHYATCESADFQIDFAKQVKRNKTIKIFAEWPRGHAKSVWVNVFIPFWLWMNGECHYLVVIGNSHDKAKQLLADLQAEFEGNQRIINDFGQQKQLGTWELGDFQTKNGFIAKALGIGQSVRGLRVGARRPDLCVGDDIETKETVKSPKRQDDYATWVEHDLIPTMDGDIRRFMWANNRFAPRMIQTVLQLRHPKWKVHHIKAYNPVTYEPTWSAKYTAQYWKDMEDEIGILACKAEFNQDPHIEGKIFTDELFRWDNIPRLNSFDSILAYWDVAYSGNNDYNAVRVWGKQGQYFYLIKAFVRQCKMNAAIEWMFMFNALLPKSVHINYYYESQFWNDALQMTYDTIAEKFRGDIPLIKDDRTKGKKYDRIVGTLPYYQQGRIIYNIKEQSSNDMQEGIAQLKGIEPGYNTHDDSPDADEGALFRLNRLVTKEAISEITFGEERRNYRY